MNIILSLCIVLTCCTSFSCRSCRGIAVWGTCIQACGEVRMSFTDSVLLWLYLPTWYSIHWRLRVAWPQSSLSLLWSCPNSLGSCLFRTKYLCQPYMRGNRIQVKCLTNKKNFNTDVENHKIRYCHKVVLQHFPQWPDLPRKEPCEKRYITV